MGNEWEYVKECLDTNWVSSVGPFVDRFEKMTAEYLGAEHAVAMVNGTAALHACLILAKIEAGDEVIMPALTFVGTANAAASTKPTRSTISITSDVGGLETELFEPLRCSRGILGRSASATHHTNV